MTTAIGISLCFAMIGGLGMTELLVIGAILVFLFGGAKLPKLARSLGQSIVEFKRGVKGDDEDEPEALPASETKQLPKNGD